MAKKNENIAEETVKKTTKKAKTEGEAVEKQKKKLLLKSLRSLMKNVRDCFRLPKRRKMYLIIRKL